jgi:hypothetical protein
MNLAAVGGFAGPISFHIIGLKAINCNYRPHKNIGFPRRSACPYPDVWAEGIHPTPHALPDSVAVASYLSREFRCPAGLSRCEAADISQTS